ncbi:retropepsin-like aspartic protease [Croceiramulus getboli]|nr:retropepsin-like aspartic protease [Flavobacteriaceae bacterium YJPT1-3]
MASLRQFLLDKGYKRIRLHSTNTNHLEINAVLNGVHGTFILDTGASSTCIDFTAAERYHLLAEDSEVRAAGAGNSSMHTQLAQGNQLKIGQWERKDWSVVLFDLSHVNNALREHQANEVDGIIGADVLEAGKGIIDYKYKCLYLK